jgi:hypothetical protein
VVLSPYGAGTQKQAYQNEKKCVHLCHVTEQHQSGTLQEDDLLPACLACVSAKLEQPKTCPPELCWWASFARSVAFLKAKGEGAGDDGARRTLGGGRGGGSVTEVVARD